MLFVKPVLCHLSQKAQLPPELPRAPDRRVELAAAPTLEEPLLAARAADLEDEDPWRSQAPTRVSFGELMIHQTIEVVEFVLGSVSNTASYLRLWALSLAHSQLASVGTAEQVFLQMTVLSGLQSGSTLAVFFGFPVWFGATAGVLMLMDVLECFLHALRLHW